MDIIRRLIAEFIGTFALVFVGVAAICVPAPHKNLLSIALAFGLTVAVMVAAIGHISGGHINPAVSLALMVTRKISPLDTLLYIIVQLVGATLAALILVSWFGSDAVRGGTPIPTLPFTPMKALWMEVILTFLLMFVIMGTAVDKRGPGPVAALLIGLTVTLDILIGGPYTGASMNPARSFGPAIASSTWDYHWVYWVGPVVGGVLAALVYDIFFLLPVRSIAARRTGANTGAGVTE
jgi:MIP family channel proteins